MVATVGFRERFLEPLRQFLTAAKRECGSPYLDRSYDKGINLERGWRGPTIVARMSCACELSYYWTVE